MTDFYADAHSSWIATSWLQFKGWENVNPEGSRLSLWRRESDEVAVPLLTDAPDYWRRWRDLVQSLAEIEQSTPEAVLEEFLNEGADISEWRVAHTSAIDETIPLSTLHTLTGSVKSAVIAAANATISPRGYFGHSIPKKAREAAELARAGQTRRGSYVLPIISRLPSLRPDRQSTLDVQAELRPYQRQVMLTMSAAMERLHTLTVDRDSEPSQSAINDAVGLGVSHELVSAVANSLEDPAIGSLTVSFNWARAVPGPDRMRPIEFPADSGALVRHVAERLKDSDVSVEQRVIGSVRRVERRDEDEMGSAIIRANMGGAERSVRMLLNDEEFHEATTALDQRRPIFAIGVVERRSGTMWLFKSVHQFGMLERLSLDEFESYFDSSDSRLRIRVKSEEAT